MKKNTLIAAGLASILSLAGMPALAQSPDWDLIEVSYIGADIEDSEGISPTGVKIEGSYLIGDNVFLTGAFGRLSDDIYGVDVDVDQGLFGLGYRYSITSSTDLFTAVSYQYLKVSGEGYGASASEDDTGYAIDVGLRSMLNDSFELGGKIGYLSIDSEGETTFGVNANYYVTRSIAVGAEYTIADDIDMWGVSLRYAF